MGYLESQLQERTLALQTAREDAQIATSALRSEARVATAALAGLQEEAEHLRKQNVDCSSQLEVRRDHNTFSNIISIR